MNDRADSLASQLDAPPSVVDAEFEVVSPPRDVPAQYERRSLVRMILLWANRHTAIPDDPTTQTLHLAETWRLAVFLAVNLFYLAMCIGVVVAAGALARFIYRALMASSG